RRSGDPVVDPHVVDDVLLREDRVVDPLLPAPSCADGLVEDEVVRLVERPFVRTAARVLEGEVRPAVDEEVDPVLVPLRRVDVEVVVGPLDDEARPSLRADSVVEGGGVHVGVYAIGIEADILHDVDLAARGPVDFGDVRAEHPDGRPRASPGGELGADLDAAVRPGGPTLRGQARRGDLGASIWLLSRLDDEVPALDAGIFATRPRIVLRLVVAEEALLVGPPAPVGGAVDIEFIRPDESPVVLRARVSETDGGLDGRRITTLPGRKRPREENCR